MPIIKTPKLQQSPCIFHVSIIKIHWCIRCEWHATSNFKVKVGGASTQWLDPPFGNPTLFEDLLQLWHESFMQKWNNAKGVWRKEEVTLNILTSSSPRSLRELCFQGMRNISLPIMHNPSYFPLSTCSMSHGPNWGLPNALLDKNKTMVYK